MACALIARIGVLALLLALSELTKPVVAHFSVRDLLLITGGLFLLCKAVKEIHRTIELKGEQDAQGSVAKATLGAIVTQIIILDIVFSVDSVITAIGLTDQLWVIITSVIASFLVVLYFAISIGEYMLQRPALKILALSFLITIGVTIFTEGMHQHVPKGYIYLPMSFALMVELLQMRYQANKSNARAQRDLSPLREDALVPIGQLRTPAKQANKASRFHDHATSAQRILLATR